MRCNTKHTDLKPAMWNAASAFAHRRAVLAIVAACSCLAVATTSLAASQDRKAPSAPSNLTVTNTSGSTISLSWNPSHDNKAGANFAGYTLYVNGTRVATSTVTNYTFTGLACGTSYTLGVDSFDTAGNRSVIVTIVASTSSCSQSTSGGSGPPTASTDTSPPTVPTRLAPTGTTTTSISISWTASTDDVGVTGYDVYRSGTVVGTTTGTTYTFAGLSCGTSYTLGVDAYDAVGNRSAIATVTASTSACPDTSPPSTPAGLIISSSTATSISIMWNASFDNLGVAGYDVYLNGSRVATTVLTSYTFTALTCGASYTLGVDSFDAGGNRSAITTVIATTSACGDQTAPTTPTNLTVGSLTTTSISISWTASTDNVGIAGYDLYLNGASVGKTTNRSYTFGNLACGTSYTVGVDAYDAAGNHSQTASVKAATSQCSAPSSASGCSESVGSLSLWSTFAPGQWPDGCWRPYSDSSPFNQPLPDPTVTPLDANSSNIVKFINTAYGSSGFSDVTVSNTPSNDTASNWNHPVYWAHAGDPAYVVRETAYPGNNNGATILIPNGAQHALGGDAHLAVVQPDGTEQDFWGVSNSNPIRGGGTLTAGSGANAGSIGGSGCCSNSTAANQDLAAGLIRGQELQNGAIQHALVVTLKCDSGTHVYPATGNGQACSNTLDAPAEGQRFQLRMSDAQVDALAVPDYRKIILKAMIHYGFYVTDTGGSPWDLEFDPGIEYTSFGYANPLVSYVQNAGLTTGTTYTLTFNGAVDWTKLQVVNLCVTLKSC